MPSEAGTDWNPETYGRFRGLRLRPAMDLLSRVVDLPAGPIIDLGCGSGQVGPALKARWPDRKLIGVDRSPAMLEEVERFDCYDVLCMADARDWRPETRAALIFSNALCHWLPDQLGLFGRLAGSLAPGGSLAVQMPRQQLAPSHALMRQIAERIRPDIFDFADWHPQVGEPSAYFAGLSALGRADLWETEYQQYLRPVGEGHPVRQFTQSTAMRPFEDRLEQDDFREFLDQYDKALVQHYPILPDGGTVLAFRRLFFVLTV